MLTQTRVLISSECCHLVVRCCIICSFFNCVFSLSPYLTENTQPGNSGGRDEQDVTQSLTHT